MLGRKNFLQNKLTAGFKNFGKEHHHQDKKKIEKKKNRQNEGNKENVEWLGNRMMNTVDMTKKIRKVSPKKNGQIKMVKQYFNGIPLYRDRQLGLDEELRNMIQAQRIDNDVETDEEQVECGVRRLTGFLQEAIQDRMHMGIGMQEEFDI